MGLRARTGASAAGSMIVPDVTRERCFACHARRRSSARPGIGGIQAFKAAVGAPSTWPPALARRDAGEIDLGGFANVSEAQGSNWAGAFDPTGISVKDVSAVPEPAGAVLMLAGVGPVGASLRRRGPA